MLCLEDTSFWKEDAKEVAVIETVANSELTYIDNVLIKSGYADKAAATAEVTDMSFRKEILKIHIHTPTDCPAQSVFFCVKTRNPRKKA